MKVKRTFPAGEANFSGISHLEPSAMCKGTMTVSMKINQGGCGGGGGGVGGWGVVP